MERLFLWTLVLEEAPSDDDHNVVVVIDMDVLPPLQV